MSIKFVGARSLADNQHVAPSRAWRAPWSGFECSIGAEFLTASKRLMGVGRSPAPIIIWILLPSLWASPIGLFVSESSVNSLNFGAFHSMQ